MSCLKGIKSIGGYVSTPVDKVEYTGIEYTNPDNQVTTVVIVDQTNRTIAVSVENLNKISAALLDPQPVSTVNDSYILLCTVKDAERSYEWISYSELLDRITADEESIKELREDLEDEISRAKSIEEEINNNLTKEISRATKSEEDLKKQIDDETSNRIIADNNLNNSLNDEVTRATNVENTLTLNLNTEKERAIAAEFALDTKISNEIANRESGDNFLKSQIDEINAKIPEQASSTNQLADKDFVNSSISTSTATFRGTYNSVDDLPTEGIDNNDYAFVKTEVQTGLDRYDKYTYNGTKWVFEYSLNNSSFTDAQWKAINSNITEDLTTQITINKNNISTLNTSLSEEINRAKEAESNLSTSINNEKERAENAENTLTTSLNSHITNKENPHEVTKAQIGLENVDNTSDKDKPVSTATQTSLDNLKLYVDNLIKSMGELKGTLEEGTLIIGPGEQK